MIRRIKEDVRAFGVEGVAELFLITGIICSFAVLAIIWSGNLPVDLQ